MKTRFCILFLAFASLLCISDAIALTPKKKRGSESTQTQSRTASLIQENLNEFYSQNIREKLYLQTDKPYYSAGDTIWFRGFLVDAASMKPITYSQFIYVELINQSDSVLYRAKIINNEGNSFHNCLRIAPHVPAGNYLLRAYTQWMRNFGEDFFFKKIIPIGNTIDDRVITTVNYELDDEGYVTASILFTNMNLDPIIHQRLSYTLFTDNRARKNNIQTDDNGRITLRFPTPSRDTSTNRILLVINDNALQFEKTIFLPAFSDDFDVQFFPESGHLLPFEHQIIAFKAIGSHGLGVDISGRILNEKNEELTTFTSSHRGMGSFYLQPYAGERYHAEITSQRGKTLRVELPPVESSGATLKTVFLGDSLLCRIQITRDLDPSAWRLVILNRDKIMAREEGIRHGMLKRIPLTKFQAGITRLALVDTLQQQTLCERLVFVPQRDSTLCRLTTDQDNYKKRQWVKAELSVLDEEELPLEGSFAISITDRKIVHQDSLSDNILSDLLMTSDLKGYIEDPGYYFLDNDKSRQYHLDLLMMTQGWTRYSVTDRLQNKHFNIRYPLEWSQSISGSIIGALGRPLKESVLTLLIPDQNYAEIIKPNAQKQFKISGLHFEDSSILVLHATNSKNWSRGITLEIDQDSFPKAKTFFPLPTWDQPSLSLSDNYLEVAKQKYYEDGGTRVIDIKPIAVKAHSKEELYTFDDIQASQLMKPQIMEQFSDMPLYQALQFMGLYTDNEQRWNLSGGSTGRRTPTDKHTESGAPEDYMEKQLSNSTTYFPLAMLNDRQFVPVNNVMYSPVNIYESIGLLSSYDAQFVMMPSGFISEDKDDMIKGGKKKPGLLLLKLKEGMSLENAYASSPQTSKIVIMPLGYKKPEAFYQPKYDVPANLQSDKPDLRTTIYWNPNLRTDAQGKVAFGFYTADRETTYDVTLEGVSDDGKICRYTTTIQRTAE